MSKVLLVEDDLANRTVIEDMFEFDDLGAELMCVTTAEEALLLAPDFHPVLILMDIRLPGSDGLEAARRLKSDPDTRHIPIWAITAYAMAEDRAKAFAAGCEDYITKPFNSAELKERLRRFVRQHGQSPAEAPAEGAPR